MFSHKFRIGQAVPDVLQDLFGADLAFLHGAPPPVEPSPILSYITCSSRYEQNFHGGSATKNLPSASVNLVDSDGNSERARRLSRIAYG
jgi:hypothetical protein